MRIKNFNSDWFFVWVVQSLSFAICVADTWFGSNQQFLCRCTDNKCLPDGTCADGASCLSEWFGPSCQYQNLVTTATIQPNNALASVTDDTQCNVDPGNQYMQLTWNNLHFFSFLWMRFKTQISSEKLNIFFIINDAPVKNIQVFKINNVTVEVRSQNISMINSIKIYGDNFQDLCSLYVNGGEYI
ncbi:uncharacterized protein LOC131948979 [Physella acuta]|uniref:uncharacterized protein LOC131948979 n=1 Tax=Physella acuta TaxID=109671 RepID=UPI0027DADF9E|nr:uncharacterized protein LOC131948979 [Physella acuta]